MTPGAPREIVEGVRYAQSMESKYTLHKYFQLFSSHGGMPRCIESEGYVGKIIKRM